MAETPLSNTLSGIAISILVDGNALKEDYSVESILIEKEVGKISEAKIVLFDGDPSENTFEISESEDLVPGKEITIKLGYDDQENDVFEGVITKHSLKVVSYEHRSASQLVVTCKDKAFKMDVVPKSANFSKKKDSDIISSIVSEYGLTATVDATTYEHPTLIQYQTSDWQFILDRARANGMIVLNDARALKVKAPDFSDDAVLTLDYGSTVIDFNADLDANYQLGTSTYKSWGGLTGKILEGVGSSPSLNKQGDFDGDKLKAVGGEADLILSGSIPETAAVLKSLADSDLLFSRLSRIKGSVSFPGSDKPIPGSKVELTGFGERFNGDAFVSKVTHEVKKGFWKTRVSFGLEFKSRSRSALLGQSKTSAKLSELNGLHIGTVKKIDEDPDGEFRVQIDLPVIEESGDGVWARLSNYYATNGAGFNFFPEVGDEVVLGFLGADPRFPIILGSLYSKTNVPEQSPTADNFIKSISTTGKLKLSFDDEKGVIILDSPNGNKVTLDDENSIVELADSNGNTIELSENGIEIKSSKDLKLTADGAISIAAQTDVSIEGAGGDVSLKGNNINSKANIALKAEGAASAELKASGNVIVKGAMVMIN